ncbi:MAG TPA: HAMP domain-containing protein, partial [Gaiellaceae bacterium]|nr:HAMP domain-containing protein [Gaiellaceae bacterium]
MPAPKPGATGRRSAAQNGASDHVDPRELEPLLAALHAARAGTAGVRLRATQNGIVGELVAAYNDLAKRREETTAEIVRVSRAVGRDGRLDVRADVPLSSGTWTTSLDALNAMIDDLVRPIGDISRAIDGVASGDLSQKIELRDGGRPLRGEFAQIAKTTNRMLDQLSAFAAEVTRVAREVGTEGQLGGQARVKGVAGTWKDLTESVNGMAANLTSQVRNIAEVTTAVANGDLSKKVTVDVRGEVLELKETVNTMVDQLSAFTDEVT